MKQNLLIALLSVLFGWAGVSEVFALDQKDGVYQIGNAQDLEDFSNLVASGNGAVNAVLTADIEMAGVDHQPIGTVGSPFKGTFDGHGYRIKNMIIETEGGNKGLFGLVSGATIKNVIVDKSCEIYSKGYSAGIAGTAVGKAVVTFENCGNEATVNVGQSGANGAGILGVNDMSEAYVKIINCFNTGDIVGERECGAISGWLGDRAEVINCYNSGEVVGVDGNRTFVRYNGSNVALTNCYEVNGNQVTTVEKEDVASGKLCYDLNQGAGETIYYQTLGSDDHPIFDATHKVVVKEGDTYVNDSSTGISTTVKPAEGPAAVYSLSGVRQQQLGRGVNIVRKADGNVVKVIVK